MLRVCEVSQLLGVGIPCTYLNSASNTIIDGDLENVTFSCPQSETIHVPLETAKLMVRVAGVNPPFGIERIQTSHVAETLRGRVALPRPCYDDPRCTTRERTAPEG